MPVARHGAASRRPKETLEREDPVELPQSKVNGALALALGLAGCGPAAEASSGEQEAPRARLESHVFEANSGDTVHAELGRFRVPLNRERGGTDSLELAFVRLPSTSPEPGPPIVYLAGGPGGSGVATARGSRFALFTAFRRFGDVIAFDQRGTGMSEGPSPEGCDMTRGYPPGRPLYAAHLRQLTLEAARACGEMWREAGVDLAAYDTRESADDVAALASAVGVDRIRLWGISYGTHLALAVIRRHPDLVERAILAGVEGPDHTVKTPAYWSDQLEDLERLVVQDPATAGRFPDLRGLVESVLDRVEEDPPVVEFISSDRRDTVRSRVSRFAVEVETIDRLRDPGRMVTVPWLYRRMADGDFSLVASPAPQVGGFDAMPEATDAASGISEERLFRLLRDDETHPLGAGDALTGAYMADALGIPDLGASFRTPVRSSIPALFISGTLDGRTPPANAEEVLRGFPAGRHLVIENAGHSDDLFLSSLEIRTVMEAFLAGDPLPTTRIRVEPPTVESGRLPPSLSSRFVDRIVGAYRRSPGDVWRVVRTGTVRSLDAAGREAGRREGLFLRIRGNGYPFAARADTTFYIPFFAPDLEFAFQRDGSGRVTELRLVRAPGDTTRFEPVEWDALGFIESRWWLVAGPYRSEREPMCETAFPPEERARSGRLEPAEGRPAGPGETRWRAAEGDDGFVNFEETLGGSVAGGVGYAFLTVEADRGRKAEIRVGTDDDARIFLNGREIHAYDGAREAWEEQDTVPVTLRSGDNALLVKVCNRDSDWRFNLRITDPRGRSLVVEKAPGRVRVGPLSGGSPGGRGEGTRGSGGRRGW